MRTVAPWWAIFALCVLGLGLAPARGGSVLDLPAATPITATPFVTVTVGAPGSSFHVAGMFTGNVAPFVGHVVPFTEDEQYVGTFELTVNFDLSGNAVSGSILERLDYRDGNGFTTLFQSDQLLAFDHVSGTDHYRFAFRQEANGSFQQGGMTVPVAPGSIIGGVVFSGAAGLSGPDGGTEAKTWVATPTPTAAMGGLTVLAAIGGAGVARRRWASA